MAFGVNSAGTVVGTDGNGNAFTLSNGKVKTFIPLAVRPRPLSGSTTREQSSVSTSLGERDAGVHQGQFQDLHHDQCPFGAEHS